jgi:cephalosporin hydroxylase
LVPVDLGHQQALNSSAQTEAILFSAASQRASVVAQTVTLRKEQLVKVMVEETTDQTQQAVAAVLLK